MDANVNHIPDSTHLPQERQQEESPSKIKALFGHSATHNNAQTVEKASKLIHEHKLLAPSIQNELQQVRNAKLTFGGKVAYQNDTNKRIIQAANRIIHHFGSGTLAVDLQTLKESVPTSQRGLQAKAEALLVISERRNKNLLNATKQILETKLLLQEPLDEFSLEPIISDVNTQIKSTKNVVRNKLLMSLPTGTLYINEHSTLVFFKATINTQALALQPAFTENQLAQLEKRFNEITSSIYSNIGPMLDFMTHLNKQPANTSMKEAFRSFQIEGETIFDKYHGGDCTIDSAKLTHDAREIGIKASVVGVYCDNPWTTAPASFLTDFFPNNPFFSTVHSQAYIEAIDFSPHCGVVAIGGDKVILMDPRGEGFKESTIRDTKKTQLTKAAMQRGGFTNPGDIIKAQMVGKFKAVATVDQGRVLGYDLVIGNIFVNKSGTEGLKNIPEQQDGRCSILLENLKNPNDEGIYVIDGRQVSLTHKDALQYLYLACKERFGLPDDFVANVLLLAKHKDAIISEVLTPGTRELIDITPRAQVLAKTFLNIYNKLNNLPDKEMLKDILHKIQNEMRDLVEDISAGHTDNVSEKLADLEHKMAKVVNIFEEKQKLFEEETWTVNL